MRNRSAFAVYMVPAVRQTEHGIKGEVYLCSYADGNTNGTVIDF